MKNDLSACYFRQRISGRVVLRLNNLSIQCNHQVWWLHFAHAQSICTRPLYTCRLRCGLGIRLVCRQLCLYLYAHDCLFCTSLYCKQVYLNAMGIQYVPSLVPRPIFLVCTIVISGINLTLSCRFAKFNNEISLIVMCGRHMRVTPTHKYTCV